MKKKILQYDAVFEREDENGYVGYSVWVPDLPGCASQGKTLEEAIENIKEAMELYLEDADEEQIADGSMHKDRYLIPVKVQTP